MNKVIQNEEVNLYALYLILKKQYKIIIGTVIIGILVLGITTYVEQPVYRTSFTVKIASYSSVENDEKIPVLSSSEIKKIFDELNSDLKDTHRINSLFAKRGLLHDRTRAIVNVTATSRRGFEEFLDVSITVRVAQPVNDFEKAILLLLNERMSEKLNIFLKRTLLEKRELDSKINKIEQMRDIVFTQITNEGLRNIHFNPFEMERDLVNYKMRSIALEKALKHHSAFEITAESMALQRVGPKTAHKFALAVVISLLAGTLLSFFVEWYAKNVKKD